MKLKLAFNVVSRAKRLFQPAAREFEKAGVLIRHASLRAAIRCAKLGTNTDVQFHKSLKEFLAFFCVIALNEIAIKSGRETEAELKEIYDQLVKGVCEGHEPDPALLEHQLTVNRLMTYKKSGFDHWFYGYWNADLTGMRITPEDLKELEEKQIPGPSGDHCADAGLILLVRLARLETAEAGLPDSLQMGKYDAAIQDEVGGFVRGLKAILG